MNWLLFTQRVVLASGFELEEFKRVEEDEGIIIRIQPLGETSLIVSWLTREHGLLKTAARGARARKSALSGKLDLYFTANLSWSWAKRSELHFLREVQLVETRLELREQWQKLRFAAWFSHLNLVSLEAESPEPQLYELLRLALDYLRSEQPQERLLERFESRFASELGLGQKAAGLHYLQDLPSLDLQKRPFSLNKSS